MTLLLKLDLDMVKMYYHAKNEVSMSRHSKVISRMDTQTDADGNKQAIGAQRQTNTFRI